MRAFQSIRRAVAALGIPALNELALAAIAGDAPRSADQPPAGAAAASRAHVRAIQDRVPDDGLASVLGAYPPKPHRLFSNSYRRFTVGCQKPQKTGRPLGDLNPSYRRKRVVDEWNSGGDGLQVTLVSLPGFEPTPSGYPAEVSPFDAADIVQSGRWYKDGPTFLSRLAAPTILRQLRICVSEPPRH